MTRIELKGVKLFVILIIVGLMVSCSQGETASPIEPEVGIRTSTPSMTIEAQNTYTPEATMTETPRPTQTGTATMIPTMSKDSAFEYIEDLYADNGGCELPCWWGITPGISNVDDLMKLLSPLDVPRISHGNGISVYAFAFEVPLIPPLATIPDFPYMEPDFIIKDQTVSYISLNSLWVSEDFDYSLHGLLRDFGVPTDIWIRPKIFPQDAPHPSYYYLNIVFEEFGMIVSATDDFVIENRELTICIDDLMYSDFPPALNLFDPQDEFIYEDYYDLMIAHTSNNDSFFRLEDIAFGYDEIDFYDQFIQPTDNICIALDEEVFVNIE
jgi:hypothetical protein